MITKAFPVATSYHGFVSILLTIGFYGPILSGLVAVPSLELLSHRSTKMPVVPDAGLDDIVSSRSTYRQVVVVARYTIQHPSPD